jgi:hypothetical protein
VDGDFLACPTQGEWDKREIWFIKQVEDHQGVGSYVISEQACALIAEVQTVFCAGAWLAVIVLALAVVEAQFREIEFPHEKGNMETLLKNEGVNQELHKLRKRRNALLHLNTDNAAITVDQQWANRDKLEADARKAIKLIFEAFYISPGT